MRDRPTLWLLAGGNGAGKSTFYREMLYPLGLPFVNADLIAKSLDPGAPELASYTAAAIAERFRKSMLEAGGSFCFETVFSHPGKIDFLALAKSYGFASHLVYIDVGDVELNAARVLQRVGEGGHNVPRDKIISRIPRSRAHVVAAVPLVDSVTFIDNSSASNPFRRVASIKEGALTLHVSRRSLPRWVKEMLAALDRAPYGLEGRFDGAPEPWKPAVK